MSIISIQLLNFYLEKYFNRKGEHSAPRLQQPFDPLGMAYFHSLLFFSLCNTCTCQSPSVPSYRSAPHRRGGATSQGLCPASQPHIPTTKSAAHLETKKDLAHGVVCHVSAQSNRMAGAPVKFLSMVGFSLICLKMVSSPFWPTCNYLGGRKDTFNIFLFF